MLNEYKKEMKTCYAGLEKTISLEKLNTKEERFNDKVYKNMQSSLYFAMKSVDLFKIKNMSKEELENKLNQYNEQNNTNLNFEQFISYLYHEVGGLSNRVHDDALKSIENNRSTELEKRINALNYDKVVELIEVVNNFNNEQNVYDNEIEANYFIPVDLKSILAQNISDADKKVLIDQFLVEFDSQKEEFEMLTEYKNVKCLLDGNRPENVNKADFIYRFKHRIPAHHVSRLKRHEAIRNYYMIVDEKINELLKNSKLNFTMLDKSINSEDEKFKHAFSDIYKEVKESLELHKFENVLGVYYKLNFASEIRLEESIRFMRKNMNIILKNVNKLVNDLAIKEFYDEDKQSTLTKVNNILNTNNTDLNELTSIFGTSKSENINKVIDIKDKVYTEMIFDELFKRNEIEKECQNDNSKGYQLRK